MASYSWLTNEEIWMFRVLCGEKACLDVPKKINWQELLKQAMDQCAAPLLYPKITELKLGYIPQNVQKELAQMYFATLVRHSSIVQDLLSAATIFKEAGIENVLSGGAALWADVYPDIATRTLRAVDMLVHKNDMSQIEKTLIEHGFCRDTDLDKLPFTNQMCFRKGHLILKLRWNLRHGDHLRYFNYFDIEDVFKHAGTASLNGVEVRIPSPVHQFVLSVMHLAVAHDFDFIDWLYDLVAITRRYDGDIDWKEVIYLSKKYRIETAVYYSLRRAINLFDSVSMPEELKVLIPSKLRLFLLDMCVGRKWRLFAKPLIFDRLSDWAKHAVAALYPSPTWIRHYYKDRAPLIVLYIARPFVLLFLKIKKKYAISLAYLKGEQSDAD